MASRVADLLMAQGANLARAQERSGEIWGSTVAGLGQIPGNILEARRQQEQDRFRREEQQQRLAIGQEQLRQLADARMDESLTAQLVGQHTQVDPESGHHVTNHQNVIDGLMSQGRLQAAQHYASISDTIEDHNLKMQQAFLTMQNQQRQRSADVLGAIVDLPEDQQASAYATTRGHLQALSPNDPLLKELPPEFPGADALKAKHGSFLTDAQRFERHKAAVDEQLKTAQTKKAEAEATKALRPEAAKEGTPEQQYLAAVKAGDTAGAETILGGIRKFEEARRAAVAPEDVGVQADTRTTATGRTYVDLSKYKGKDYHAAQTQAHAQGVFGANQAESDALQNIDTARQNMDLIEKSIPKLPSSSVSRGVKLPLVGVVGPGSVMTRVEAALQTDPDLAAWGTWRTAAIQAMRATAGSKGLRINRAEIEASIENDIPEITDTQATAKEKLGRVRKMLENQERGIMGPPKSALGGGGGGRPQTGGSPSRTYYDASGNPIEGR